MKIAIVYFSATNVTHTYAGVMKNTLVDMGVDADILNITPHAARGEDFPIDEYDLFLFGFPVFADFAPSVINEWIPTLEANGKRCAQFFTYGARTTGYAHFHTKKLLEEAGFRVMLSAEFLGRHSFNVAGWTILPERPDEEDFRVAREYVKLAIEGLESEADLQLQKPFGYDRALGMMKTETKDTERSWTHPVRFADDCSMCRDCESECPTGAFDADLGESNPATCISCMRCVYICPDDVIKVDAQMKGFYEDFKRTWNLTEEMMSAKPSKIIRESWQAAA